MRGTIARIGATGAGVLLAVGLFAAAPPAGASDTAGHGVNSQDSTCFMATGHTQGRSHSDPDGMSNGGADKPGCTGGLDADRDGNNGCGNDADREDDDNGWCGRKPHDQKADDHDQKADDHDQKADDDDDEDDVIAPSSGATVPSSTTTTTTTTTVAVTPKTVTGTGGLTDCQVDPKEATGCTAAAQASDTGAHLSLTASASTPATAGVSGTSAAGTTTSTTAPGTQVLGETLSRPSSSSSLPRTGAAVGGLALLGAGLFGGGRLLVLARRLLRIG